MAVPNLNIEQIGRRLKLRDMRILMTVAECGTMGKAAEKLAVSQPAVSKAISDMEHTVGVRLLDRGQRGVEPTAYGRALIRRGLAIFDEMEQGLKEIDFLSDPGAGEVRIGSTNPIAAAIVLPVIERLTREHPRMRFHSLVADTAPLFSALELRAVDLIISRLAHPIAAEQSAENLFHDALVVATGADNPLTRRRRLALADLIREPWVLLPSDSYFGGLAAEIFRQSVFSSAANRLNMVVRPSGDGLLATQRFLTVTPGFSLLLPRRRTDMLRCR